MNMREARRRFGGSKAVRLLLAAVLMIGLVPALSAPGAEAAGSTQRFYKADVRNPVNWGGYANFAEDGTPAWCMTPGLSDADAGGTGYTYSGPGGRAWDYLVAEGYPNTTIEGYRLSEAEAIGATHGAGWLLGSGGDYAPTGMSSNGQAAAYALYSAAASYGGGDASIDGCSSVWDGPAGYQRLVTREQDGGIDLQKESADPSLTDGNPCYSLKGAEYGVYESSADARADRNREATLKTDASGYAKAENIPVGTHYVKEVKASSGYGVDPATYSVSVKPGKTARVNGTTVTETPVGDPAGAVLGKYDGEKEYASANLPQGSASLALAQYTIKYYAGLYSSSDELAGKTPMRTWVMQTNEAGIVDIRRGELTFETNDGLSHPYKVSGDDFWYSDSGNIKLPIGTISIQETKAPEGYLLPDPNPVYVQRITYEGAIEGDEVKTYNMPEVPERVARGDVALTKVADKAPTTGGSGMKDPLAGVDFQLINDNDGAVLRADGSTAAKGEAVVTITTDDRGYAETTGGALPYGTYVVHEVPETVPAGYATVDDFKTTISEDGQEHYYVLEDGTGTAIRIVKTDAETGQQVAGHTTFRVLDKDKKPVTFTRYYPTVTHMTAFTTDATGSCVLPEKLNGGEQYYVQEIKAPGGYVLSEEPVPFVADGDGGWTWDNPLTVTLSNAPQKGTIDVAKTDAETGEPLEGAEYEVAASGDIVTPDGTVRALAGEVVARIATDEQGRAETGELYLGSYEVYETSQPDGYVLDETRYPVEIAYGDQSVEVVTARLETENAPNEIVVAKTRAGSGEGLEGVEIEWWDVEREASLYGDPETFVPEDFLNRATTDSEGRIEISRLAPGEYGFREAKALPGYVLDDTVRYVAVDGDGTVDGSRASRLDFVNDYTKVEVSKTDAETGEELPGCSLALYRAEGGGPSGEPIERWTSGAEPRMIEGLEAGDYILREETPAPGYLVAQDLAFAVDGTTGEVQKVAMADDYTKIDVEKTASDTGEPLEGATLAIRGEDGRWIDPRDFGVAEDLVRVAELDADGGLASAREPSGSDRAVWQLADPEGNVVGEWPAESSADGSEYELSGYRVRLVQREPGSVCYAWKTTGSAMRLDRLDPGSYTLVELAAPRGYEKADPVEFGVAETGDVQRVGMVDERIPGMPTTGDAQNAAPVALLALAICAGTIVAFAARRMAKGAKTGGEEA